MHISIELIARAVKAEDEGASGVVRRDDIPVIRRVTRRRRRAEGAARWKLGGPEVDNTSPYKHGNEN